MRRPVLVESDVEENKPPSMTDKEEQEVRPEEQASKEILGLKGHKNPEGEGGCLKESDAKRKETFLPTLPLQLDMKTPFHGRFFIEIYRLQ